MSESFVVAEGAAVAEQPQGVDLSMDMLEAYRARLLEIQGRLHQLKEETRQTVEQLTNTLTKGVVGRLISQLSDQLEEQVTRRNDQLQRVLNGIDDGLTSGRQVVERMAQLQGVMVEQLNGLHDTPLNDDKLGPIQVGGVAGNTALDGFRSSTEKAIAEITELRQRPAVLLEYVEDKLSVMVASHCSHLKQVTEARLISSEQRQHQAARQATEQLNQTAFLFEKMTALGAQLNKWINEQQQQF